MLLLVYKPTQLAVSDLEAMGWGSQNEILKAHYEMIINNSISIGSVVSTAQERIISMTKSDKIGTYHGLCRETTVTSNLQ